MKTEPLYKLIAKQNKIKDSIKKFGVRPGSLRDLAEIAKEIERRQEPLDTRKAHQ